MKEIFSTMKQLFFPNKFFWGASTSSHQVEGNTTNDWSIWENSEKRMQDLQKNGLLEKYTKENFVSGLASDQFSRYKEDFALAKELGHNATRISIEWSRIEPEKGIFDDAAITHYKNVILTLRSLGIEPFVTLWHWTMPSWFVHEGGFASQNSVEYFARYATKMAGIFQNDVTYWLTLNEPEIYTANSYFKGIWPPQQKSLPLSYKIIKNLIAAHKKSYLCMKQINPNFQIGIAKNNIYFEAYRNKFVNKLYKRCADFFWNDYFLKKIQGFQDFIGLNYYFHNRIDGLKIENKNEKVSDMGWELYPEGIYHVLKDLQKYGIPIVITENGLADSKDEKREWFIQKTLEAVHCAIQEGLDVRGYLHWSLIDNFEWDKGFWPRFGLIEIDFATQERIPRKSAYYYQYICKNNFLEIE